MMKKPLAALALLVILPALALAEEPTLLPEKLGEEASSFWDTMFNAAPNEESRTPAPSAAPAPKPRPYPHMRRVRLPAPRWGVKPKPPFYPWQPVKPKPPVTLGTRGKP